MAPGDLIDGILADEFVAAGSGDNEEAKAALHKSYESLNEAQIFSHFVKSSALADQAAREGKPPNRCNSDKKKQPS
jgi:hypothetical protein